MKSPVFIRLNCFLVFAVCFSAFGSEVEESGEQADGILQLALARDIDWLALAVNLEDEGVDIGEIYEALFARFMHGRDLDSLVAIFSELDERKVRMPVGQGRLFFSEIERDGFLSGLAAIRAEQWGDIDGLRRFSRDCVLKNPEAFDLLELRDLLEDVRGAHPTEGETINVALETELLDPEGESENLAELLNGGKGLYLDFWASWCGPCIRAMPQLKARAALYESQGLTVVGVNTDSENPRTKTVEMGKRFSMKMPWLIEPVDEPLSGPLGIRSIPRVVIINPTGDVLFNGHPDDFELKLALLDLGIVP